MPNACGELKQPDAVSLALARANRISARQEIEQYLFQLLTHECKIRDCKECQILDGIEQYLQERIFK